MPTSRAQLSRNTHPPQTHPPAQLRGCAAVCEKCTHSMQSPNSALLRLQHNALGTHAHTLKRAQVHIQQPEEAGRLTHHLCMNLMSTVCCVSFRCTQQGTVQQLQYKSMGAPTHRRYCLIRQSPHTKHWHTSIAAVPALQPPAATPDALQVDCTHCKQTHHTRQHEAPLQMHASL